METKKNKKKLAVLATGVLGLTGAGVALAQAGATANEPPTAVFTPVAKLEAPAQPDLQTQTVQAQTPAGPPGNVQQGDQTTADNPAAERSEGPEREGAENEREGVEEPGDENLPGGGHADPPGQDVNHEFEGVE